MRARHHSAPVSPATEDLDILLARGDDRAALETLMARYGEAVLRHCEAALADLGDASLGFEARHDTFIEAFQRLGPIQALPEPERFLLAIADESCTHIRRAEKHRRLAREPLSAPADWQAVVRWEVECLLQEKPEGPDRALKRRGRKSFSIWPPIVLGILSLALLLVMWNWK